MCIVTVACRHNAQVLRHMLPCGNVTWARLCARMCILEVKGGERVWGLEDSRMCSMDRGVLSNEIECQSSGCLSHALVQEDGTSGELGFLNLGVFSVYGDSCLRALCTSLEAHAAMWKRDLDQTVCKNVHFGRERWGRV